METERVLVIHVQVQIWPTHCLLVFRLLHVTYLLHFYKSFCGEGKQKIIAYRAIHFWQNVEKKESLHTYFEIS